MAAPSRTAKRCRPSLRPALPASIVTLVLADLADDRPAGGIGATLLAAASSGKIAPDGGTYCGLGRLRRFVISVDARVITVASRGISVDPRGNWG
jgi:hypothetical protein